jgi:hypothetical protein
VTGSFPDFSLAPGFENLGSFKVTITVTDDNPSPKTGTYTFTITVTKDIAIVNNTNSTNDTSVTDKVSKDFKAQIRSITMMGEVYVAFSDNIRIPANYTSFNNSVILVEIKDSSGKKVAYNYTW